MCYISVISERPLCVTAELTWYSKVFFLHQHRKDIVIIHIIQMNKKSILKCIYFYNNNAVLRISLYTTVPFWSIWHGMLCVTHHQNFHFSTLQKWPLQSFFFSAMPVKFFAIFEFSWPFFFLFAHTNSACARGQINFYMHYLSAILEGLLHFTAILTKMVQYVRFFFFFSPINPIKAYLLFTLFKWWIKNQFYNCTLLKPLCWIQIPQQHDKTSDIASLRRVWSHSGVVWSVWSL